MQLVVRQQLHAPLEVVREHLEGKVGPRRDFPGDVVQGRLEGQPVEGGGAVGKQLVQHLVNPLLARGLLQIRLVLDVPQNDDALADRLRLHEQLQAVGERGDHRMHRGNRHGEPVQAPAGPLRQGGLFGGCDADGLLPAEAPGVTAFPDASGVSTATMALSGSRYCRATRSTSAAVTFSMARISSAGDCRPSTARALDQAMASPEWNSSELRPGRLPFLAASTRSAGKPWPGILQDLFHLLEQASASPSLGKAARASPGPPAARCPGSRWW